MAEAVRSENVVTRVSIESQILQLESLPVITDDLPISSTNQAKESNQKLISEIHTILAEQNANEKKGLEKSNKIENIPLYDERTNSLSQSEAHLVATNDTTTHPMNEPSIDGENIINFKSINEPCNTIEQISAPSMIISPALREINHEFTLPNCYTISELKNFYCNPTADALDSIEHTFIEEASCEALPISTNSDQDVELPIQRPYDIEKKGPLHEHPLYRLIIEYSQQLLYWQTASSAFGRLQLEVSKLENSVWKLEQRSDKVTGKCRDGYDVFLNYDYQSADFIKSNVHSLAISHTELRSALFERLSLCTFKVSTARLDIESYLAQILKKCPSFANFAHDEPVILLFDQQIEPDLREQLDRLRRITSVLFACLRRVYFTGQQLDADNSTDKRITNDVIDWIMCITGRYVRQCRVADQIYVAMQLLRVPFNLSFSSSSSSSSCLASLLQPPGLDMAWLRVGQRIVDFIEEPEVAVRVSLFALCLRTPRNRCLFFPIESSSQNKEINTEITSKMKSSNSSDNHWTLVDSGGESDEEFSANSSVASLKPIASTGESVCLESLVSLIDQADLPGLIQFLFNAWDDQTVDSRRGMNESFLLPLIAFANWILTVLEHSSKSVFMVQDNNEDIRLYRQLSKRFAEIICLLLSGIRSRVDHLAMTASSEEDQMKTSIYPQLAQPRKNEKLLLAQYDSLCLRGVELLLSCGAQIACWRRFTSLLLPLRVYASKTKLRLFTLLIESVSLTAGRIEIKFCDERFNRYEKEGNVEDFDATLPPSETGDLMHKVLGFLRGALIEGCLGDAFVAALGRIGSTECRPPPPLADDDQQHCYFWAPTEIPYMERLLVQRIVTMIFKLCVVPSLHQKEEEEEEQKREKQNSNRREKDNGESIFANVPLSVVVGRDQLVSIVSTHPTFAFRQLLDLILVSASHLDDFLTKSSTQKNRPDLPSPNDSEVILLDLIDVLPLRLLKPNTDDLSQLLSWIGGYIEPDLIPLRSLRSRIARKLLTSFPWEAVVNATGEPLIAPKLQNRVAVAIATSFYRYIIEPSSEVYQPAAQLSKISLALESAGSYTKDLVLSNLRYSRTIAPYISSSTRSSSNSPPRISGHQTSNKCPPIPLNPEAAAFYQWSILLILRLRLQPSTRSLTHLFSSSRQINNPLSAFLALQFQSFHGRSTIISGDPEVCQLLHFLAAGGHFSLAIEAFSRLVRQADGSGEKMICPAFVRFVSCLLQAGNEHEAAPMSSATGWMISLLWRTKGTSRAIEEEVGNKPGSVMEAFLGALMDAFLDSENVTDSSGVHLFRAVVSSVLLFSTPSASSSDSSGSSCGGDWKKQHCAIWLLDRIFRTDFWMRASANNNSNINWWQSPVARELQPTIMTRSQLDSFPESEQHVDVTNTSECDTNLNNTVTGIWQFNNLNRLMSSSWSEGLSTLLPTDELRRLLPWRQIGDGGGIIEEGEQGTSRVVDYLISTKTSAFWLLAYLIGVDSNVDDGGYSLWDDVLDTVTWNRAQLLTTISHDVQHGEEKMDLSLDELTVFTVFIGAGLLPTGLNHLATRERLVRLIRRLPLVHAISALFVCPLDHPAFFLLMHISLAHCLQFTRNTNSEDQSTPDRCLPPGFLLLRLLPWTVYSLIPHLTSINPAGSSNSGVCLKLTIYNSLVGRLQEALQFWLKQDQHDDPADPYGLRSSSTVACLRQIIGLLSDMEHMATHIEQCDSNVEALGERIRQFDTFANVKNINLEAIASSVYTEIERWNLLRSTRKCNILEGPTQLASHCESVLPQSQFFSKKLKPLALDERRYNELLLFGPVALKLNNFQHLVQECTAKLDQAAAASNERSTHLEHLQQVFVEKILPRLYHVVNFKRIEVVDCHSYISLPLLTSPCKGGARISVEYQTATLDPGVDVERQTNRTDVMTLLDEARSDSKLVFEATTSLSAFHPIEGMQTGPTVPQQRLASDQHVHRRGAAWVLAGFRLQAVLQRIVEARRLTRAINVQETDSAARLVSVFDFLCQSLSGLLYKYEPTKIILSKCIDMLAGELLSAGDCAYETLLDTLTRLPHLTQLLTVRIRPQLLIQPTSFHAMNATASTQLSRANQLGAFYRRIPLIHTQCGFQATYDLLGKLDLSTNDGDSEFSRRFSLSNFGSAVEVNALINDAFKCLVDISRSTESGNSQERESPDLEVTKSSIMQLLRPQVSDLLRIDFPKVLQSFCKLSAKLNDQIKLLELWRLVNCTLAAEIQAHGGQSSLPLDGLIELLQVVNQTSVQLRPSQRVPSSPQIIDCLGLLTQQLALKLTRMVELNHVNIDNAQKILNENFFESLWSWIVHPSSIKLTDETSPIPLSGAIKQLVFVIIIIRDNIGTHQSSLSLLDNYIDAVMTRAFTELAKLDQLPYFIEKLKTGCQLHADAVKSIGFPWFSWRPSSLTLGAISEAIQRLYQVNSHSKPENVYLLSATAHILSHACWEQPTNFQTDDFSILLVALVCAYDQLSSNPIPESCSSDLRTLISMARKMTSNHQVQFQLPPRCISTIKSHLRPVCVLHPKDTLMFDFFQFLKVASHMILSELKNESTADPVSLSIYPQIAVTPNNPTSTSNIDLPEQRQAYVSLMVTLISSAIKDISTPPSAAAISSSKAVSETMNIPTLSFLANIMQPMGSFASNLVASSSLLWQRVFSGGELDVNSELARRKRLLVWLETGPFQETAQRICSLLSEVEICCRQTGWESITSQGYGEAVVLCEILLRMQVQSGIDYLFNFCLVSWLLSSSTYLSSSSASSRALCRPLLQALFYQLPEVSTSSSSTSVSNILDTGSPDAHSPQAIMLESIVSCIWAVLQTDPSKDELSGAPRDFVTRLRLLSELFVPNKPTDTAKNDPRRLYDCVSWLVPSCKTFKKLLPLYLFAYSRHQSMCQRASTIPSGGARKQSTLRSTESPAILLADIMHWLTSVDLKPSNVYARNCADSSQLTAFMLLLNLALEQIARIERISSLRQVPRLVNWLNELVQAWKLGLNSHRSTSREEAVFVNKFSRMSECLTSVLEEWCSPSFSSTESPKSTGLLRLRNLANAVGNCPEEDGSIPRALLARLEQEEDESVELSSTDVLDAFTFLCQQFWSPLLDFTTLLLTAPN